jgi:hypothetical protein
MANLTLRSSLSVLVALAAISLAEAQVHGGGSATTTVQFSNLSPYITMERSFSTPNIFKGGEGSYDNEASARSQQNFLTWTLTASSDSWSYDDDSEANGYARITGTFYLTNTGTVDQRFSLQVTTAFTVNAQVDAESEFSRASDYPRAAFYQIQAGRYSLDQLANASLYIGHPQGFSRTELFDPNGWIRASQNLGQQRSDTFRNSLTGLTYTYTLPPGTSVAFFASATNESFAGVGPSF